MKHIHWTLMCLLGGLLMATAVTPASADEWNKKTYVTISQSIEVPGAILPPGKYVFKLLDSQSNRHIVQILNDRENHVYATNLAIPTQRMEPADKTIITFYEMPGGGPEPIRSWYYPGDTIGQEFSYPADRARQIAQGMHVNVPALAESRQPAESTASSTAIQPATPVPVAPPAVTEQPATPPETAAAEPPPPPPAVEEQAPQPEPEAATPPPTESAPSTPAMPHTAGDAYAIALAGLTFLVIGVSVHIARRQSRSEQ